MQNQQVKPTENKVLTSLCKKKLIMVRFMAFSCRREKVLIYAWGQTCLPRLWGSLFGLHACLSLLLNITSPRMYLAFIFLSTICSLPTLCLPLSACLLLKYTHLYLWI